MEVYTQPYSYHIGLPVFGSLSAGDSVSTSSCAASFIGLLSMFLDSFITIWVSGFKFVSICAVFSPCSWKDSLSSLSVCVSKISLINIAFFSIWLLLLLLLLLYSYSLQAKKRMMVENHQYNTPFFWFQHAQARLIQKLCSVLKKDRNYVVTLLSVID